MLKTHSGGAFIYTVLLLCSAGFLRAQQGSQSQTSSAPSANQSQTAGSPSQSLAANLGVYVFPANKQTPEQQSGDESSCFSWAKQQTGIDPLAPAPQETTQAQSSTQSQQSQPDPTKGSGARGAAGGAAAGAAIGAIAGDAGEGAAIGATAGAVRGRRQAKKAKKQQQQQEQQAHAAAQQQAQQQTQAQASDRKNTYNRAFGACMEGKGYTVK